MENKINKKVEGYIEEFREAIRDKIVALDIDKEMQTKADMDAQALNALVQVAVQQQQEMTNDEER